MFLFLISLVFLLLHIVFYKSVKINRILVIFAFLFVCSVYTILATNSYHSANFLPKKNLELYFHTGNFYNWLMTSFFNFKLELNVNSDFAKYLSNLSLKDLSDQSLVPIQIKMFYDTSIYDDKIYLYFGVTPIILFYAPFYLITRFFLSDQIVFLFLSIIIFVLQVLIFKKILLHLIQENILNKNIYKYFSIPAIMVLSLCNGIPLTYIAITVHSITILTSVFCSLVALYTFLLLSNNKYKSLKMFFMGLFLALSIGARPTSIVLTIFLFFAVLIISNFNIKIYRKQYFYFFLPLFVYGIILAVYNYLRFDSFFDFGYTYQFSPIYQKGVAQNLNHSFVDFTKHMFLNIFHLPVFVSINPFCVFKNYSNVSYFEPMIGGIIVCPIIIFLIFVKNFIAKSLNKDKFICLLLVVMISASLIHFLVNSYIGSNARFVCEYLFLLLIPSLISYHFLIENTNNIKIKNILKVVFFIFVIFSLYINTNLINCIFLMSKNGLI